MTQQLEFFDPTDLQKKKKKQLISPRTRTRESTARMAVVGNKIPITVLSSCWTPTQDVPPIFVVETIKQIFILGVAWSSAELQLIHWMLHGFCLHPQYSQPARCMVKGGRKMVDVAPKGQTQNQESKDTF